MKSALIFAIVFSFPVLADVSWPETLEIEKIPTIDKKLKTSPKECSKVSEADFLARINKNEPKERYKYKVRAQIDLNLDGKCEIIAFQPIWCGKWCGNFAFIEKNGDFENIGNMPSYFAPKIGLDMSEIYLVPYNEYIQIIGKTHSGGTVYFHHYRLENGKYKNWRSDIFNEDKKYISRYSETIYNKNNRRSAK